MTSIYIILINETDFRSSDCKNESAHACITEFVSTEYTYYVCSLHYITWLYASGNETDMTAGRLHFYLK